MMDLLRARWSIIFEEKRKRKVEVVKAGYL